MEESEKQNGLPETVNELELIRAFELNPDLEIYVVFTGKGAPLEGIKCKLIYDKNTKEFKIEVSPTRTIRLNGSMMWREIGIVESEAKKAKDAISAAVEKGDARNPETAAAANAKALLAIFGQGSGEGKGDRGKRSVDERSGLEGLDEVIELLTVKILEGGHKPRMANNVPPSLVIVDCEEMVTRFGGRWPNNLLGNINFKQRLFYNKWTAIDLSDYAMKIVWLEFASKMNLKVRNYGKIAKIDIAIEAGERKMSIQFKFN